jgi:hypothetical protein
VGSPGVSPEGHLSAVAARSANDAWAVAEDYGKTTIIEHWNGTAWSAVPVNAPGLLQNSLLGVIAISTTEAWAVGYYQDTMLDGASQALIEHYTQ